MADQLLPGKWEGQYLDVNGHRGQLRMSLDYAGDTITGRYELRIAAEDKPQVIAGTLQGKTSGNRLNLSIPRAADAKQQQGRQPLAFDAEIRGAGSHAEQAMFGTIAGGVEGNFGGGVWIAWRFKRSNAGGK